MKYHHSLLEWPKAKKLTIPNADKDVEQQEISVTALGMQNGKDTLEEYLTVLPYDTEIMLLDIYLEDLRTNV